MPSFRGMRQTVRGGSGGYEAMYGAPMTDSSGRKVVSIGGDSSPSAPALSGKEQRRKDKALKNINKNPLTPSNDPFTSSDSGFEMSQPARDFQSAKFAEYRLSSKSRNKVPYVGYDENPKPTKGPDGTVYHPDGTVDLIPISPKTMDQDTVNSYVATGKGLYSRKGQAHLKKSGAKTKSKKLDPYS